MRSSTAGRTAECPLASAFSRAVTRARASDSLSSGPTPALWLRTRLVCSSVSLAVSTSM